MLNETVKQRINAALNFQETEQVPCCDLIENRKIFNYFTNSRSLHPADKIKAYHELGVDICWNFQPSYHSSAPGLLGRIKTWAFSEDQLKLIPRELLEKEFIDYQKQKARFEPHTYLAMSSEGCLDVSRRNMGNENFSQKLYSDPLDIERVMEIFAENLFQRASMFAEHDPGPVFFILDDISNFSGMRISLRFLREQWLPKLQNAIIPLKDKGVKVVLHSRGDLCDLIPDLIEAGVDGIHPVDPNAGMNIGIIKKNYARSLLLFGNVDIYNKKTPKQIYADTKKCMELASFGGGHFIGSCYGINDTLELKQVFSFFSAIKEGLNPA